MLVKEAWEKVHAIQKNSAPETAYELDELYVFSIRPKESSPGVSTGSTVITVNKKTGKVEGVVGDDPRLTRGKTFKFIKISEIV